MEAEANKLERKKDDLNKFIEEKPELPKNPAPVQAPQQPSDFTQLSNTIPVSPDEIRKTVAALWTSRERSSQSVCMADVTVLVATASGEHLQRGMVLEGGAWKHCFSTRLLEPATGVKLVQPCSALPAGESTFEFFSSEDLSNFDSYASSTSIETSFSVTGMFSTFGASASAKGASQAGGSKSAMHQSSESVYAKCVVHTVPIAACLLECSNLQLSSMALDELKNIEATMSCKSDITAEAVKFFEQYGSHAIAGMVHFGGVHITTAYAHFQSTANIEQIKENVSLSLGTAVKGGNLLLKAEASVGVATSSENNSAVKSDKQSSDVQLKSNLFGGPPDASTVSKWYEGLMQNSDTWAVIDSSSKTIPVWQLVRANKEHFLNADLLANALCKAWEDHTRRKAPAEISDTHRRAISSMQLCIDELMLQVTKETLTEENWLQQLQKLRAKVQAVEQLTDEEMRGRSWTQNPHFHAIVRALVRDLPQMRGDEIKKHISVLLEKSGSCSFPMRGRLEFQLACSPKEDEKYCRLTDMDLDCPLKLADALQNTVLPDMQTLMVQHEDNSQQRKVKQLIFVDLNSAVQHLLGQLKKADEKEMYFMACIALARNTYSLKHDIFEKLMNEESLKKLAENLKESAQKLHILKQSTETEFVQATLLHGAMEARLDEDCCFEVGDWIFLFDNYSSHWAAPFDQILADIRDNSSKVWSELSEQVTCMLNKFSDSGELLHLPEKPVKELLDAQSKSSGPQISESQRRDGDTKEHLNQTEIDLMQQLGLTEYFPSKIRLCDVMSLGDEAYSATVVTQIPLRLLKSFVQADYKSGTLMVDLWNDGTLKITEKQSVAQSFWDDEDEDGTTDQAKQLHYSDVVLASLLSCNMRLQQLVAEKLNDCKHAFPLASACAGSLELRVWSLRSCRFVYPDPLHRGKTLQMSADVDSFPIISFMRLGKSEFSKSSLINKCISDKHEIFPEFNSVANRALSDGSVEQAWAVPDPQNESLGLKQVTCILNLRGDGLQHQQQLTLLAYLSACIVVVLPEDEAEKDAVVTSLRKLLQQKRNIILLRTTDTLPQSMKEIRKELGEMESRFQGIRCWNQRQRMTHKSIATELKTVISNLKLGKLLSLDNISTIAQSLSWQVDERQPSVQQALSAAQTLMQFIDEKEDLAVSRNQNLPLSGTMWQRIAKMNKNLYREKRMDPSERAKWRETERDEIRKERQKQFICVKKQLQGNSFLQQFIIQTSSAADDSVREIFLQRLKLYLDALCRKKLPQLTKDYQQALLRNREAQTSTNLTAKSNIGNDELTKLEKKMEESAFGLEQVFREIGQVYEAIHNCCSSQKVSIAINYKSMLTSFAADLLLKGEPLEVMDGNASACPVQWVSAVLDAVEKKVGTKSLLVLAVLGLQSSGKSTLLNSLFGLQLAVSAGRCTKGAFLQLVPNDRKKSQLNADYIAVIDSEGLRSSEIAEGSMTHDNELATMIIGLADLTIMNMYGEGLTDTRDILQVVVHAFLRMKAAFGDIIKKKSCIFIHQNVAAVNAAEETRIAKEKLLTQLDESTRAVAKEEQQMEVRKFTDVIEFADSNVFFLPHLWEGKPPMAPVSPDYCKDVMKVKTRIIAALENLTDSTLSFGDLSKRIRDLWNAVLKEDFVFSFQNTVELQAYRDVEHKFAELKMKIEKTASDWFCDNSAVITGSSSSEELAKNFIEAQNEMKSHVSEAAKAMKEEMTEFICSHRKKEICKKWQQEREITLHDAAEKAIHETNCSLERIKETQRVKLLNQSDMGEYQENILKRAKKLAEEKQGNVMSDEQLETEFKGLWGSFMADVHIEKKDVWKGVDTLKSVLEDKFYFQRQLLNKELESTNSASFAGEQIAGSFPFVRIKRDDFHNTAEWAPWKNFIKKIGFDTAEGYVHSECNDILKKADEALIQSRSVEPKVILKMVLSQLVTSIIDGVKELDSGGDGKKKPKVSLTPKLTIKLAVHAGRFAEAILKRRQDEFDRKHGLKAQLETFRDTAFTTFKNFYKKESEEVIAADFIASCIKQAAIRVVCQRVTNDVTMDLESPYSGRKLGLIKAILKDLAEKGRFLEFIKYIQDSKQFAENWLRDKMENYLQKEDDKTKRTHLRNLLKEKADILIYNVEKDMNDAADSIQAQNAENVAGCSLSGLVHVFCKGEKTLGMIPKDFEQMSHVSVKNLSDFKRMLNMKIKDTGRQIEEKLEVPLRKLNWEPKSPHLCALEKLWGCPEHCPHCHEPCTNMTECNAVNRHCCMQHRIKAVSGGVCETDAGIQTGVSLDTCGTSLAHDMRFYCSLRCKKIGKCEDYRVVSKSGRVLHKYSDFHKIFPDWNLLPDHAMDNCDYWKWFLVTFKEELKAHYGWKVSEIPNYGVTKSQAIESLDRLYKG